MRTFLIFVMVVVSVIINLKIVLCILNLFAVIIVKRPVERLVSADPLVEHRQGNLMDNDNCFVVRPKKRQGPTVEKSFQGSLKDAFAGTVDKDTNEREHGIQKEETLVHSPMAPESKEGQKEPKQSRWDQQPAKSGSTIGCHDMSMGLQPPLQNILWQPFHPEDSNSKVIGNGEGIGDETADSISSILRKEIEGNISISKHNVSKPFVEGKDSLGDSFVDAKDDLLFGNSHGTSQQETIPVGINDINNQDMKVDMGLANRKGKMWTWRVNLQIVRKPIETIL